MPEVSIYEKLNLNDSGQGHSDAADMGIALSGSFRGSFTERDVFLAPVWRNEKWQVGG